MNTKKTPPGRRRSARAGHDAVSTAPPAATADARAQEADNGPTARCGVQAAGTQTLEHALEALAVDHATAERIQKLPHDIGWLLVTAGVVGVVMPGVLGVPFLALGGLILLPGTNRRAERWLTGHSPRIFKGSIRQINRFLDDLERRYPRSSKP